MFNDPDQGQVVRRKYELPQLQAGKPLSATLAFERPVTMKDSTGAAKTDYLPGYTFDGSTFAKAPPNLDLYLMPKGAMKLSDAVWASTSKDSSVEHFYFQMPNAGAKYGEKELFSKNGYELWAISREPNVEVPYGLAWWGVAAKAPDPNNPPKKMSGMMWNETDGNNLRGPTETGRSGVTVSLRDSGGNPLDSVKTDWQGKYQFDVAAGMYQVEFSRPRDAVFVVQDAGSDDIDSDANQTTGRTSIITVSGADVANIDAGLVAVPPGTVSGSAFNDANGDGLRGTGETGYVGVRVVLSTTDSEYAGAADTDATGNYQFSGVAPGNYVVYFARPVNAALSPKDAGSDSIDSDADPLTGLTDSFTLASGGVAVRDVGVRAVAGSVAGVAYFDADLDGVRDTGEEGIGEQPVELRNSSGQLVATTLTEADGSYRFDELAAGAHTVTFVPQVYWMLTTAASRPVTVATGTTATADAGLKFTTSTGMISGRAWADMNGNGLREGSEPGRAGVVVELRTAGTTTVVATATTDGSGAYWFPWIAPGNYDVRLATAASVSPVNQGSDDAIDSDFEPLARLAASIPVAAWQHAEHIDAGLLLTPYAVTGRVMSDANGNGLQDADESGVAGAQVQLLDVSGNVVGVAFAAPDGTFQFANLPPGTYRLRFLPPTQYPLATFAPKDVGGNDAIDSDADSLGYTDFFTITPSQPLFDLDALLLGIPVEPSL